MLLLICGRGSRVRSGSRFDAAPLRRSMTRSKARHSTAQRSTAQRGTAQPHHDLKAVALGSQAVPQAGALHAGRPRPWQPVVLHLLCRRQGMGVGQRRLGGDNASGPGRAAERAGTPATAVGSQSAHAFSPLTTHPRTVVVLDGIMGDIILQRGALAVPILVVQHTCRGRKAFFSVVLTMCLPLHLLTIPANQAPDSEPCMASHGPQQAQHARLPEPNAMPRRRLRPSSAAVFGRAASRACSLSLRKSSAS